MIIISDASPIINLASVGQLELLHKLYGRVVIPQAVYDEVVVTGRGQLGALTVAQADWIDVKHIANRPLAASLQGELDLGEAEAIVLAVETKASLLLIDERKGRIAASRLGVNFIGLLGVLIKAKHEGMISTVGAIMDDLKVVAGFWISDDLYRHVLQAAGEDAPSYE